MKVNISKTNMVYIAAAIFAVLFVVFKTDFLAVAAALMFIIGVVYESMVSAKEKGVKNEIKEIVIAVVVAIVLWYGTSFALNTSSPFNAVVSCSMLNTLQRGDVVVLQGAKIETEEVNLVQNKFNAIISNREEHYVCGFCKSNGEYRPCSIDPLTGKEDRGEVLQYKCGVCDQNYNGEIRKIACAEGVYVDGKYFDAASKNGDIVVYRPKESDLFAAIGDIIHRAVLKINAGNESYYLIKGDNNPMFDVQAFDNSLSRTNSIVKSSQILGKSIFTIPFIGYVKLVAAGQFSNPENCNTLLTYKK